MNLWRPCSRHRQDIEGSRSLMFVPAFLCELVAFVLAESQPSHAEGRKK